MYKNSSAPSSNTTLQHYLGIKHLDFRRKNNSTSGILIEEIRYIVLISYDQTPSSSYMASPLMVYQATYNMWDLIYKICIYGKLVLGTYVALRLLGDN